MAKIQNWESLPTLDLGIMKRKIFTGENVMLVKNVVDAHSVVAAHKHVHEQIVLVLSGECDIEMEGKIIRLKAEDMALVPPNVEHKVTAIGDEPFVVIDIFSPIREDFLK